MSQKLDSVNRVVNYLRQGILSGTWIIGEKIPSENEICLALNVGRASVRDALSHYVSLGMLKSVHGKGTFVCCNDLSSFGSGNLPRQLLEIMLPIIEFRYMLEPEICYHATLNSDSELIKELKANLSNMGESVDNVKDFSYFDMNFHLELAKSTNNAYAYSVLTDIFIKNMPAFYQLSQSLGSCNGLYYHAQILDAVKENDPKKARLLMKEHLEKTKSELLLALDLISP